MTTITLSRVSATSDEPTCLRIRCGQQTDAYVAAFTLPDWLNYIVAGDGFQSRSSQFYTRFLAEKREQDAQKTFSIISP